MTGPRCPLTLYPGLPAGRKVTPIDVRPPPHRPVAHPSPMHRERGADVIQGQAHYRSRLSTFCGAALAWASIATPACCRI